MEAYPLFSNLMPGDYMCLTELKHSGGPGKNKIGCLSMKLAQKPFYNISFLHYF